MKNEQAIIHNYGILTSISWNSNDWADNPTSMDLKKSQYKYVRENRWMNESLNFGHEVLPAEEDGYFIGYTPMFRNLPAKKSSKDVGIVFFMSSDYHNSNRKSIVGFYGNPAFGEEYDRIAKNKLFKSYDTGNIKALTKDIIYFENPIIINQENVQDKHLLPEGKKISKQGFNYLDSDNVFNLIGLALQLNPKNKKLERFVNSFSHIIGLEKEKYDLSDFIQTIGKTTADTAKDIQKLEKLMQNKTPELKQRISTFIERGNFANKIKKMTGYKCLICESLGVDPLSFIKPNGDNYVEAHHVEHVSTMQKGVLSISNLITVCANHHRQLHYGKSKLIEQTNKHFTFEIDGKKLKVRKIIVS